MNTYRELFKVQVPFIYTFDYLSIYNLSRGKPCFKNSISEYFAGLVANKQIELFGVTRRQALISVYLFSEGFRMVCQRYPELFQALDSVEPLDISRLRDEWYKDNGTARGGWSSLIAKTISEIHFQMIELPQDQQSYKNELTGIAYEYSKVWYTQIGTTPHFSAKCSSISGPRSHSGCHHSALIMPENDSTRCSLKSMLKVLPMSDIEI